MLKMILLFLADCSRCGHGGLTVLLHDAEELDDDLGGRTDQDLALAGLLGVVDGVKRIVEDGGLDHFGGFWRFSVAALGD